MPFNWFNRQYDDKSKAADNEPKEAVPPAATPTEPAQPEQPAIAEDYLAWAKAAYKNIQKQQEVAAPVAETADSEAPPEVPVEPISAVPAEVSEPEPVPVTEAEPMVATPAAEPSIEPVAVASTEETLPEPSPPAPEAETTEAATPPPEPEPAAETAPLPFWAQAEADRQARLERLRAAAIADAEPDPQPQPLVAAVTTPEPEIPLELDEGFLWSAEVLAAQGRRPDQISIEEITWLNRLRQGLDKTRRGLVNQLRAIVGQGPLNQDAVMEIEAALLQADVGVEATDAIVEALQEKLREEVLPPDQAISYLKQILREMLDRPLQGKFNATFAPEKDTFNIWLITGVNGAGKTTTIGKLAHIAQKSGYRCLIAAADTFRAAAVEQVKVWGQRSGVEIIANPGQNTDPAAVVFDAITAAQSRQTELLLVDTAGRLQNKKNLMDELSKIRRIIDKKASGVKVESLLVLDATLGQNGLRQAQVFAEVAQLSGVVITKLDGTAKGGIALAVVQQLGLPIRFIGAGEGIEDLRPFSSYEFVEALLNG